MLWHVVVQYTKPVLHVHMHNIYVPKIKSKYQFLEQPTMISHLEISYQVGTIVGWMTLLNRPEVFRFTEKKGGMMEREHRLKLLRSFWRHYIYIAIVQFVFSFLLSTAQKQFETSEKCLQSAFKISKLGSFYLWLKVVGWFFILNHTFRFSSSSMSQLVGISSKIINYGHCLHWLLMPGNSIMFFDCPQGSQCDKQLKIVQGYWCSSGEMWLFCSAQ